MVMCANSSSSITGTCVNIINKQQTAYVCQEARKARHQTVLGNFFTTGTSLLTRPQLGAHSPHVPINQPSILLLHHAQKPVATQQQAVTPLFRFRFHLFLSQPLGIGRASNAHAVVASCSKGNPHKSATRHRSPASASLSIPPPAAAAPPAAVPVSPGRTWMQTALSRRPLLLPPLPLPLHPRGPDGPGSGCCAPAAP